MQVWPITVVRLSPPRARRLSRMRPRVREHSGLDLRLVAGLACLVMRVMLSASMANIRLNSPDIDPESEKEIDPKIGRVQHEQDHATESPPPIAWAPILVIRGHDNTSDWSIFHEISTILSLILLVPVSERNAINSGLR